MQFCCVSAEEYRQEYVRDAFINGLHSPVIRQRLLESHTLTLQQAFQQARTLELAQKHSANFQSTSFVAAVDADGQAEASVAAINKAPTVGTEKQKCFFCSNDRRPRNKCPAKDSVCNKCTKIEHSVRVCRSTKSDSKLLGAVLSHNQPNSNQPLLCSGQTVKPSQTVNDRNKDSSMTTTYVKNSALKTLIDTGSDLSFISEKVADKLKLFILPISRSVTLADCTQSCTVVGEVVLDITVNGTLYSGQVLSVLNNLFVETIIGKDIMKKHKSVTLHFEGPKPALHFPSQEIFSCNLTAMSIEPPTLFANIPSDVKPIACKSRKYTIHDKNYIAGETNRMLKEGIIEPSMSPWRAQVLVVPETDTHRKRLVIDYSRTINTYTELDAYPLPRIDETVNEISNYSVFSTLDLKSAYHQIPLREDEKKYTAFESGDRLYQFTRMPYSVTNGVAAFQRTIDIIEKENIPATFAYVDNVTIGGKSKDEHDQNLKKFLDASKKYGITFNHNKSILSSTSIKLLGYEVHHNTVKSDPDRLKPLIELPPPEDTAAQRRVVGMFAYYSRWIKDFSSKIRPLVNNTTFPLREDVRSSFDILKKRP